MGSDFVKVIPKRYPSNIARDLRSYPSFVGYWNQQLIRVRISADNPNFFDFCNWLHLTTKQAAGLDVGQVWRLVQIKLLHEDLYDQLLLSIPDPEQEV